MASGRRRRDVVKAETADVGTEEKIKRITERMGDKKEMLRQGRRRQSVKCYKWESVRFRGSCDADGKRVKESKRQEANRQSAGWKRREGKGGERWATDDAGARPDQRARMRPRLRPTVTGPRKSGSPFPPRHRTVRLLHDHFSGSKHDTLSLLSTQ